MAARTYTAEISVTLTLRLEKLSYHQARALFDNDTLEVTGKRLFVPGTKLDVFERGEDSDGAGYEVGSLTADKSGEEVHWR